jgi:hypothetical protein
VVWQGDAFEDEEHRYVVKKADLLSSKLFRALFGGAQAAARRAMGGRDSDDEMGAWQRSR